MRSVFAAVVLTAAGAWCGSSALAQGAGVERVAIEGVDCCPEGEHPCAHAKIGALGRRGGVRPIVTVPRGGAPTGGTDVQHYLLNIEIDPVGQFINGTCTMSVLSTQSNLTTFQFRLQNNFTISSVQIGATNLFWTRIDAAHVDVTLDHPYNPGESFDLVVGYSGTPLNNGFDSISFSTHSGFPIVSTLSETDFAYTWWPNKDDNVDKATGDMRYTVPSAYVVAANGLLTSTTPVAGGKLQYRWQTAYPTATYLFSFSATNYEILPGTYTHPGGSMPLQFFLYPESNSTAQQNAYLNTAQMMTTFRPMYGEYPFIDEKYGIYHFQFGGGMEHQTMTGQTPSTSESLTAHELSHQWWGDMTTCATWNNIWLNEGFATYGEALWLEKKPGSTGLPALHTAMAGRRPSSVNGSCYIPEPLDTSNISRIFSTSFSYRKPAWVLHMLRHIIGDSAYFDSLAAYRANHEFGSATTDEFRAAVESVVGRDLFWFFDEWIYKIGAPAYRWNWRPIAVNGRTYVELYIQQVQSGTYGVGGLFKMPLDVRTTIAGSDSFSIVWNDAIAEHLLIETVAAPTGVALDPTPWVLATSNSTVAFVEGPPKVLAVEPLPGSSSEAGTVSNIDVFFQKDVTIAPGNLSLVGQSTGPVSFGLVYDAALDRARLTPLASLVPDVYTLTVLDTVRDTASNKQLDGETVDPNNWLQPVALLLPTGNGLPGGAAAFNFTVTPAVAPPCVGDANGDGAVDFADITSVLANFGNSGPPVLIGDADFSGTVDFGDITSVLANFGMDCP